MLGLVTEAYGGRGGIAQYNRDFYGALASLPGIRRIDLLPRGGEAGAHGVPGRLRVHPVRPGRASYAAAALRLALRLRPDIVICGHAFMVSLAACTARLCGARLVVQLHGIEIWREPPARRRSAMERADLVLCVSRDTRRRVLAMTDLLPERVVVLPNTVSDDYTPGPRRAVANRPLLLSVGRLDAREGYKGHDAVIACLPELAARGHDATYCIAGEGDDRPRLETLARDGGVADRVRFPGEVSGTELRDLYRAADLFVLPSSGEGFGIVFLEALACGTPALGLALGGAVDPLDALGRAVPEGGNLAEAIAVELDRSAGGRRESGGCRESAGGQVSGGGQEPAGGRQEADRRDLAARVLVRFGRPAFERGVARALSRLGFDLTAAPPTETAV